MSSLKAIASVSYVLQQMLIESLADPSLNSLSASVSTDPLDKVEEDLNQNSNALNLYLYMVQENDGWRNQDLISRNTAGQRVSNPYLALDLYYVLSSHGSIAYNAELMLGYAMVALHDNPIIGREFIANELAAEPLLADSGLSEQVEQIKITPLSPNTEEVSKLWTMFGAKHRVSSYYKISVAMLRKEREINEALPVRKSKIYVQPINIPTIQDLVAAERANPNFTNLKTFFFDDTLRILGLNLRGDVSRVFFDADQSITVTPPLPTEIELPLPPGLSAGIHSVQVMHDLLLGEPEVPHRGYNSNLAAFVLSPFISSINFADPQLTITVEPQIERDTKVTILLNEINFDTTSRAANEYALSLTTDVDSNSVTVDASEVIAGTYLVRLRVNNATSPLFQDFSGPIVNII